MGPDGQIHMPTTPGLGEDINFNYIADHTVSKQ